MLPYDKFRNTKDSDKACLQNLKCKLETTRPYLNTPIFPNLPRKHLNFKILQPHP